MNNDITSPLPAPLFPGMPFEGSPQAAELIASGATQLDGDIPVNPSGGCMGANPIGAVGLIRLIEGATQVMGRSENHQIKDAKLALVQSGGGWANLRGCAVLSA